MKELSLGRRAHLKENKSSELCREPRCQGIFYHPSVNLARCPCLFIMSTRTRRQSGWLHMHHVNLSISLPNLNNSRKVSLCDTGAACSIDRHGELPIFCLSVVRCIERGFCCILPNVFKHGATLQYMQKAYLTLFLSLEEMRWQVMGEGSENNLSLSLPPLFLLLLNIPPHQRQHGVNSWVIFLIFFLKAVYAYSKFKG